MERDGIDLLLATRSKTVTWLGGAFIPWRSVIVLSKDGYIELNTLLMDVARIKDECWLENLHGCAPIQGLELWEVTLDWIRENGYEKATIGVELGHSPRMTAGFLFATEFDLLREQLPSAKFVNAVPLTDEINYVKDEVEVGLMRKAGEIADAAQDKIRESLYAGISEMEIAGIGELEMRRRGSQYHWPVTGSNEIASGYRTWYPWGGCTPPAEKKVQRGESLLVDMHPTYQNYYSDLSHNYILGEPSREQRRLADVYLETCETLVESFRDGMKIGDVCTRVMAILERTGYAEFALPGFGHGLGVIGHEWYPAILNNDEFRDVVLVENVVEVAAVVINVPDVGGMRFECPVRVTRNGGEPLCNTPLPLTVLDA
jgi:Xaa-Pro aminopeptidase